MADDVDANVRFNEPVDTSSNETNLVVQRERCSRCDGIVIAIAAEIDRDDAETTREPLGKRRPLRLRSQRRMQQDHRGADAGGEIAGPLCIRWPCRTSR